MKATKMRRFGVCDNSEGTRILVFGGDAFNNMYCVEQSPRLDTARKRAG
jgi:hypothetical protein